MSIKTTDVAQGFQRVDRTTKPDFFINFIDEASRLPAVRSCKGRILELLNPKPGHCVLDVGCGTGEDIGALAEIVGRSGLAVGVDNSEAMLAEARRRAEGKGLSLDFRLCDGRRLEFPD
ncbi:MAG: methyltransferase domain-containing protein, partial [Pseudomonadota bacterium]|nr:methyltransferase domain-containing protein [Pseudomonadota bacterium]